MTVGEEFCNYWGLWAIHLSCFGWTIFSSFLICKVHTPISVLLFVTLFVATGQMHDK